MRALLAPGATRGRIRSRATSILARGSLVVAKRAHMEPDPSTMNSTERWPLWATSCIGPSGWDCACS